ncbi:MAG TPA: chemotaxis protein CheX [Polyangiaceae bacterium]|nr:chemotaxis protein CheX [Polyangiaceae bacterium]
MLTSNKQIFDQLIRTCVRELIEQCGLKVSDSQGAAAPMERAAAVGFSGDQVRGAIGLGMQATTLQRLADAQAPPAQDAALERDALLEDWLGETANQLLGRFKNRLLGHGASVSMALPMVLRGLRMQFASDRDDRVTTYVFDSAEGPICVWLDVRVHDGFLLTTATNPELLGAPEGALMLF